MKKYLTDEDYDFIYSKVPRVCIDILITGNSGVLLFKRDEQPYKNKYHLAGGRVRFREKINDTIHRIAKTEIGIDVTVNKMIGCIEFLNEYQSGNKRHSISIAFECSLNEDCNTGKWFSKETSSIHPVHRKFLTDNSYISRIF